MCRSQEAAALVWSWQDPKAVILQRDKPHYSATKQEHISGKGDDDTF